MALRSLQIVELQRFEVRRRKRVDSLRLGSFRLRSFRLGSFKLRSFRPFFSPKVGSLRPPLGSHFSFVLGSLFFGRAGLRSVGLCVCLLVLKN